MCFCGSKGALFANVSTYQIEKMFFDIDPRLKILHELKEKYISFNHASYNNVEEIEIALNKLIKDYLDSKQYIFVDFARFLNNHKKEIMHSFTTTQVNRKSAKDNDVYYARLSNGLMESFNRKPKDYKRSTRGSSNFDYTRNRILWATRNNPAILGVPKTSEQVHSYRLNKKTAKKRSKTYKKHTNNKD